MSKNALEPHLDAEKVVCLVKPEGLLSRTLKGFECRLPQQSMMTNIVEAYNKNQITLIEAGTGTGKSIAYLVPALVWAAQHKERTVISTHTINLQEQLVQKDIPALLEALNLKLKVALVKGMSNYVCLRKLEDAQSELSLFPSEDEMEIQNILKWKQVTTEGSRSELCFTPSMNVWDRVGAESDACMPNDCPHQQECFFLRSRRQASEAQILVVNHSLLFADLSKRDETGNYTEQAILPAYRRVILDEAHHIEEIATEYFAARLHRLELMRTLGRLAVEKQNKPQGKLPILKEKLQSFYNKAPPRDIAAIISKLTIDLPALRHILNEEIHQAFETFAFFMEQIKSSNGKSLEDLNTSENKLRILPHHQTHPKWKEEVIAKTEKLSSTLNLYKQGILNIEAELKLVINERLQEQTKSMRLDIQALIQRLDEAIYLFKNFLSTLNDPNQVRWVEAQKFKMLTNIHLVEASLDISKSIVQCLFSKFSTIVLCSATLTTNHRFDFFRQRLGLTKELLPDIPITEYAYDSPFDYQKQALLLVPTDMPPPMDPLFNRAAQEHIWKAIQASHGNAFILFTSYTMLQNCYDALIKRLTASKYTVFKQGDSNRQDLLQNFKNTDFSVLFGTDSFWEGVDVAGDALRCVVIVKLPFKVPTEPIIQARTEAITAKGGDPFSDYTLPNAIVKFKQGFGRLIRNKWDRGCIVCLDTRIVTKSYGQTFINSLPNCEKIFAKGETLYPKMVDFYRKTYHFVKKKV